MCFKKLHRIVILFLGNSGGVDRIREEYQEISTEKANLLLKEGQLKAAIKAIHDSFEESEKDGKVLQRFM